MSDQLTIHNLQFAQAHSHLAGVLPLVDLPRIAEQLVSPAGEVRFSLEGGESEMMRPALTLNVSATVSLICQRCLTPVDIAVDSSAVLVIAPDEAQLDAYDEEDADAVLVDAACDVRVLIEDELLLSLPIAPRHDVCGGARAKPDQPAPAAAPSSASGKPNPFAVLASLKTTRKS